jgi:hypothetical protein
MIILNPRVYSLPTPILRLMNEHTATDDHPGETTDQIRVTSPMQSFEMSAVTTGLVITIVGLGIIFGIPLVLS